MPPSLEAAVPPLSSFMNREVEFYDCETRFLVRSASRKDEVHLVDLEENDGRGECSCEDWQFRQGDYYLWKKPYECRHMKAAKGYVERLRNLIDRV